MVDDRYFENRYIAISQIKKSSDFDEMLHTAADVELDERHVIKNEKLHWTDSEFERTYFLFFNAVWALTSGSFRIVSGTLVLSAV